MSRYVRSLHLPGKAVPRLLAMCPKSGQLTAHSWADLTLHLFSVNGGHLASAEGTEKLHALRVSPDGRFLLSGGAKGVLTLRHAHSLQVCLIAGHVTGLRGPCFLPGIHTSS